MTTMLVASARGSLQALNRVVSLLRGRDFRIFSLNSTVSETSDVVRLAIAVDSSQTRAARVLSCLDKLEEVWGVRQLQPSDALTRELAVVKVAVDALGVEPVVSLVAAGSMRVVERHADTAIVEITGASADVDAIVHALPRVSVVEIARLGPLVMSRGADPTTVADPPATRCDHS
jgi:acetolactate synthase-1/3 small subunit